MNPQLSSFAARLRELIESHVFCNGNQPLHDQFDSLALELFALQFQNNPAYQKICLAKNRTPENVTHWTQIPFVPTSAFKELELASIPAAERTAVFHSSGTTEQKPSRHFHCAESLALYESSLWKFFHLHFGDEDDFLFLTPNAAAAPRSSLAQMFTTVAQKMTGQPAAFVGRIWNDGAWELNFSKAVEHLATAGRTKRPLMIFGTAFSFVHLLDFLAERNLKFNLPENSRVMETGGYKNRSRVLSKAELHALIRKHLGVKEITCEYGMSELSSQAYDTAFFIDEDEEEVKRFFQFPPWACAQIISPETGREVAEDETGIIRVFDLANVFSVAAIQTEDLGMKRGDNFALIGRAQLAEPRGCSLMST